MSSLSFLYTEQALESSSMGQPLCFREMRTGTVMIKWAIPAVLRCCRGALESSAMQVSRNFPLMSEAKNYIQQLLSYVTMDPLVLTLNKKPTPVRKKTQHEIKEKYLQRKQDKTSKPFIDSVTLKSPCPGASLCISVYFVFQYHNHHSVFKCN